MERAAQVISALLFAVILCTGTLCVALWVTSSPFVVERVVRASQADSSLHPNERLKTALLTARYMRSGKGEIEVIEYFSQDAQSGDDSIDHLFDVRDVYVAFWYAGVLCTVLSVSILLVVWRYKWWSWLRFSLRTSAIACMGIPALFGLVTFTAFDFLFTELHEIIFPHGNWQFLHSSLIIQTFPGQFWFICMVVLLILVTMQGAVLLIAGRCLKDR
jgi:integral membrane protein (TIGR01906 family)